MANFEIAKKWNLTKKKFHEIDLFDFMKKVWPTVTPPPIDNKIGKLITIFGYEKENMV